MITLDKARETLQKFFNLEEDADVQQWILRGSELLPPNDTFNNIIEPDMTYVTYQHISDSDFLHIFIADHTGEVPLVLARSRSDYDQIEWYDIRKNIIFKTLTLDQVLDKYTKIFGLIFEGVNFGFEFDKILSDTHTITHDYGYEDLNTEVDKDFTLYRLTTKSKHISEELREEHNLDESDTISLFLITDVGEKKIIGEFMGLRL